MTPSTSAAARVRVIASICTYERNDELRRLIDSLLVAAEVATDVAAVGVVIVDDNADGRARVVADEYGDRFSLGVHYVHTAARNISVARNAGIEAALAHADWVALTDDDCVLPREWLTAHLDVARRHGADAVTGSMVLTFPDDSPSWLHDEPFGTIGLLERADGEAVERCGTNNSMISADWLRANEDVRFDPELGRLGGEDMVFFRTAVQRGLHAHFSAFAPVYEQEPRSRATLRYQLSRARWMGNTEFVTNHRAGDATRLRLALRSLNKMRKAVARPVRRLAARQRPQLRFAAAQLSQAFGLLLGALGKELEHR